MLLGSSNKLKKVYQLEGLVCDIHAESMDAAVKMAPSKRQASELLSTTVFDYEPGSRLVLNGTAYVRRSFGYSLVVIYSFVLV